MRKYPRIEIDQKAYDGLSIEAVLQHRTAREIATEAILGYISQKALSAIDHKTAVPEDIATKRPPDHKTIVGAAIDSSKPKPAKISSGEWGSSGIPRSRKRIADDQPALAHIRSRLEQGATASELELEMMGKASSAVRRIVKGIKDEIGKD